MTGMKPYNILLVEDNIGDVRLIEEALKQDNMDFCLYAVYDGEEAMDFVRRRGIYTNVPTPDIILLDLNLPNKDGREVLTELKSDPELRRIPVIIVSSSDQEDDVSFCYNAHANCYVKKIIEFDTFMNAFKSLKNFWFKVVTLPKGEIRTVS